MDGERTPMFRAYTTLRALQIPAGEHDVVIRYEPWSFRLGAGISLLSLLALGGWAVWQVKKRKA